MLLHEDRSGSSPDIVFLDRQGQLWLYEVKRNRITRSAAAQVLCQLLCYALDYSSMGTEKLAVLYCEYKKRIGHSFYYPEELMERYVRSNKVKIFTEEFEKWFECSNVVLGGRVSRLAFLALQWDRDAVELITQVRSYGIAASSELLSRYATGKASSKWISRVIERGEQFEVFGEAEWVIERFLPPETWIVEETRIGTAV